MVVSTLKSFRNKLIFEIFSDLKDEVYPEFRSDYEYQYLIAYRHGQETVLNDTCHLMSFRITTR